MAATCNANYETRLRGSCNSDQYQCKTGECILADDFCDGFAHCPDQSDETIDSCATNCCSPGGFRCGYGGCVDQLVKCNGVSDCADGSDENYLLCGHKRQTQVPAPPVKPPDYDAIVFPNRQSDREVNGTAPVTDTALIFEDVETGKKLCWLQLAT